MHEGLDWEAVCYHCDIKSANVCLAADFTVKIIGCGLSKRIEENKEGLSSAGGIGAKGCICPDYNDGEIEYKSACDVFSFGVLLCKLVAGAASPSGKNGCCIAFEKKKTKALNDNVDPAIEWDNDTREHFVELALECVRPQHKLCPTIGNVVGRLRSIVAASDVEHDVVSSGDDAAGPKCRICGREDVATMQHRGSMARFHCGECTEDSLVRSMARGESHQLCCLKEGCDSPELCLEELEQHISRSAWVAHSLRYATADSLSTTKRVIQTSSDEANERVDTSLRLQAQLSAGNGLPCPRRLTLVETGHDHVHPWQNPREWFRNAKSVKLHLRFVCSHGNELVSNESRIKPRHTHEDLMKIAPACNASLCLLQLSTAIVAGTETCLDPFKLKEVDEWSRELMTPNDQLALDRARENGNVIKGGDAQQLTGPALSLIAEKVAEKEHLRWHSELAEAFDYQEREAMLIMRDYQLDPCYNEWQQYHISFLQCLHNILLLLVSVACHCAF